MVIEQRPLRREQIAAFVGNDQDAIRAIEKLFRIAGELTPTEIAALTAALEANALAIGATGSQLEEASAIIASLASQAIVGDTAQATAQAALAALQGIHDSLALLALAPPRQPVIFPDDVSPPRTPLARTAWGTFFDLNTQNAAAINTAYTVSLSNTDLSRGVFLAGSPATRITVDQAGYYDFQHSIQLDKTTGGKGLFYLWYAKNGTDVANSATRVRVDGNNSETVAAWNYVFDLKAGDYIEYKWSVDDTGVEIKSFATAAPAPATPSVIVSVTNNIEGQQ